MQTNNLHSFFADPNGITIHRHDGAWMACVTPAGIEHQDALRPVELDHLQEIADDFPRFHAAAFAGQNYEQQPMPIIKA